MGQGGGADIVTFEVSLDRDVAQKLIAHVLGRRTVDDGVIGDAGPRLAQLALQEYVDWVAGDERYRSLSELQIERVSRLFEELSPDEAPSRSRLYNDFGLSHGQATYIARVLGDRDLARWRRLAREQLTGKVDKKLAEIAKDGGAAKHAEKRLALTSMELRELDLAFERALDDDALLTPFKRAESIADKRWVDLKPATLRAIGRQLGLEIPDDEEG